METNESSWKHPVSAALSPLPEQPVDRIMRPLARFLHIEAGSGLVLVACTVVALVAANSPWAENYLAIWNTPISLGFGTLVFQHSLHHVINDGPMAFFFFVIGLEVKREMKSFTGHSPIGRKRSYPSPLP
jgi:NhaA family Na+:H+ antiporter